MLRKSFNYINEQRNLRLCTRLYHWLFQDGYQIAVSTDVGFTVHTHSGSADNNYCSNLVLLWIFNFFAIYIYCTAIYILSYIVLYIYIYCTDPSGRHATGMLYRFLFISNSTISARIEFVFAVFHYYKRCWYWCSDFIPHLVQEHNKNALGLDIQVTHEINTRPL